MSEMIKKRLRIIDFAGVGTLVGVIAATTFLGILPLYAHSKESQTEIQNLRDGLTKLDGLSHTLKQVETELKSTESRLAEAETRLPNSGAMDQFITQLAKVAEDAGLRVNIINPKPIEQGDNYRVMPIDISGNGSFETCYKFLTGLRHMNRLTRLDQLSLDLENPDPTSPDSSSQPSCRISVTLSTFIAR